MKEIKNWQNATVFDLESDGLLDEATKIHVLSFQMQDSVVKSFSAGESSRVLKMLQWHIDNEVPMVAHNGISYDVPFLEKLYGIDLSKLMLIDTLVLSWYLNFGRKLHGLASFLEDYGIAKPEIDDWENLSFEEYKHRCQEDVKINKLLWEDFKVRLVDMYSIAQKNIDAGKVGGKRISEDEDVFIDSYIGGTEDEAICRLLTFLMFKMDCARLQEKTRWQVDVALLESSLEEMHIEADKSKSELESVMPRIAKYTEKKRPAKPFKKSGELSEGGKSWNEVESKFKSKLKDEFGNLIVKSSDKPDCLKVLSKYEEPNANSSEQIKAFLFSKGWVPQTFKYERDDVQFDLWIKSKPKEGSNHNSWNAWKADKPKDRAIPQVTVVGDNGKELCPSLIDLAEEVPEIQLYAKYNVVKHRISVLEGFKRDMKNGRLQARISGLTNTLRMRHAEIVNLPGVDKPYGNIIRGVLIAGEGRVSVGSDMSSLEDRVKHHFMLAHDPEYVATMQAPDFDPHILMALSSGMITKAEFDEFKSGVKKPDVSKARKAGKATNYASVYNAGPPTIARAAGVSLKEAEKLHKGYWELNWAVKEIAEEQCVVQDSRGNKWLINPINGFMYSLRKEQDRFSTLCQGTGSYFFDMWVDEILSRQQEKYKAKTLTGQFHDENVFVIKDLQKYRDEFYGIIQESIKSINTKYKLRRDLGCDTQFGHRYSDIH